MTNYLISRIGSELPKLKTAFNESFSPLHNARIYYWEGYPNLNFSHYFLTISNQFSAIYINIFHKTEVQMVILRCWTGLYLNWFKCYDTKCHYFNFRFLRFCDKKHFCVFFAFLGFVSQLLYQLRCWAPQNDHLNLSFVKDVYVVGGKMAKNSTWILYFLQNHTKTKIEIMAFCVIAFEPIKV